jgi:hypothetical protein
MSNTPEINPPLYRDVYAELHTAERERDRAIQVIHDTADYYHSMNVASDDANSYWASAYITALDLTERIQGLPEGSLLRAHDITCGCIG